MGALCGAQAAQVSLCVTRLTWASGAPAGPRTAPFRRAPLPHVAHLKRLSLEEGLPRCRRPDAAPAPTDLLFADDARKKLREQGENMSDVKNVMKSIGEMWRQTAAEERKVREVRHPIGPLPGSPSPAVPDPVRASSHTRRMPRC